MAHVPVMLTPADQEIHLVGVTFHAATIKKFAGAQLIVLRPEPTNPYDKNAVAAFVGKYQIGHIPKDLAPLFGHLLREFEARELLIEWQAELGEWETNDERDSVYVRFDSPSIEAIVQTINGADEFARKARALDSDRG